MDSRGAGLLSATEQVNPLPLGVGHSSNFFLVIHNESATLPPSSDSSEAHHLKQVEN